MINTPVRPRNGSLLLLRVLAAGVGPLCHFVGRCDLLVFEVQDGNRASTLNRSFLSQIAGTSSSAVVYTAKHWAKCFHYLAQKRRQRAVKFGWLGLWRSAQDGRWRWAPECSPASPRIFGSRHDFRQTSI